MTAIERDNASLKGTLPKDFARPGLDKQRLGQLINLVSDIALGGTVDRAKDTLGRVYEYFLLPVPLPQRVTGAVTTG
jgi:type I restriction enzyme M protein